LCRNTIPAQLDSGIKIGLKFEDIVLEYNSSTAWKFNPTSLGILHG
jgi:hypothetical protein